MPPRPVYFVVEEFPPVIDRGWKNVAASYQPVLETILGSPINRAGRIGGLFVNLRHQRWYEHVSPQTDTFQNVTQRRLESMLALLSTTGTIRHPITNQLMWRSIPSITNVMAAMRQAGIRIVGCVSGQDAEAAEDFFSRMDSDHHSYAFVVGEFSTGGVNEFISHKIKVSSYSLTPVASLAQICIHLGNKWNIR